nr:PREDICTED: uncharacterized protein LOC109036819 isoform X2 [Bemisia tabaci]
MKKSLEKHEDIRSQCGNPPWQVVASALNMHQGDENLTIKFLRSNEPQETSAPAPAPAPAPHRPRPYAHQHQSRAHGHSHSHHSRHSNSHPSTSRGPPTPHKKIELFTKKWIKRAENKQPAQTRLEGMRTKFRNEREPSPPPRSDRSRSRDTHRRDTHRRETSL